jgi:hypothetical protein
VRKPAAFARFRIAAHALYRLRARPVNAVPEELRLWNRGGMQGSALVKQVSPVAWQHVNLYGRYEFRKHPEPVDVDEIVRELAENRIGTETALAA